MTGTEKLLSDGIRSIKDAYTREQRARNNLAKMLENAEVKNAKLRDALKELVVGTHAEMCADRDMWQCRECAMYHGDESCAVADAMELVGVEVTP